MSDGRAKRLAKKAFNETRNRDVVSCRRYLVSPCSCIRVLPGWHTSRAHLSFEEEDMNYVRPSITYDSSCAFNCRCQAKRDVHCCRNCSLLPARVTIHRELTSTHDNRDGCASSFRMGRTIPSLPHDGHAMNLSPCPRMIIRSGAMTTTTPAC